MPCFYNYIYAKFIWAKAIIFFLQRCDIFLPVFFGILLLLHCIVLHASFLMFYLPAHLALP